MVRLPGGYFDERGQLHDEVVLGALSGRDEEALLAEGIPAAAVTRVLARTIQRIGTIDRIDDARVRELLIADRQVLLLELRERTFGPRVTGSCVCEQPGCGQRISLGFAIQDLAVRPLADKQPAYACALPPDDRDGDAERRVTVRLPNGGDQEAVCAAVIAGGSGAQALRVLVERCLVSTGGDPAVTADRLGPADLLAIERFLVDTAPAVDLAVCARCPECETCVTVELDLQDFFFGELVTGAARLYQDVHDLAVHYHWSEHDILALTKPKRARYLGLIAEAREAADAGG